MGGDKGEQKQGGNSARDREKRKTERGEKERGWVGGSVKKNKEIRKRVKSETQKEMRVFLLKSLFSLNIYFML